MKKFELTTDRIEENGTALYRIKALIDFGDVKASDLGGYVEKEENLSHTKALPYTQALPDCDRFSSFST